MSTQSSRAEHLGHFPLQCVNCGVMMPASRTPCAMPKGEGEPDVYFGPRSTVVKAMCESYRKEALLTPVHQGWVFFPIKIQVDDHALGDVLASFANSGHRETLTSVRFFSYSEQVFCAPAALVESPLVNFPWESLQSICSLILLFRISRAGTADSNCACRNKSELSACLVQYG